MRKLDKSRFILNVDYLELSIKGKMFQDRKFDKENRGARWERILTNSTCTISTKPLGFNYGRDIHLIKFDNSLFYNKEFNLKDFIKICDFYFYDYTFKINRVDICADYIYNKKKDNILKDFYSKMTFFELYHVHQYSTVVKNKKIEYICAGSRSSKTFIRHYNKSKELKCSNKTYIIKYLNKNLGKLKLDENYSRLEFQLRDLEVKELDNIRLTFDHLFNYYFFSKTELKASGGLRFMSTKVLFRVLEKDDFNMSTRSFKNLLAYIRKYQAFRVEDLSSFNIENFLNDYWRFLTHQGLL